MCTAGNILLVPVFRCRNFAFLSFWGEACAIPTVKSFHEKAGMSQLVLSFLPGRHASSRSASPAILPSALFI